ncbi:hypothetical protein NtB2_01228 [Lactococcus termiticola]|uniref:30S ribosomal protein THX n=1 Tax=Lactococcus termiticola TaxID=2169526 RepID=A0A2R5HKI9_9LACT|nr:hypothetical protein NtB2_01228 [Lactococcus termiticola]
MAYRSRKFGKRNGKKHFEKVGLRPKPKAEEVKKDEK